MDKMQGGYQALQIRLLNGRLFQKLLSKEPDAQYRSEQGKILTILWKQELGCATATDIALATGLANNTLTSMVKKLEEQGLVTIQSCTQDKRKKYISLTDLGWAQKESVTALVKSWVRFSTKDFRIKKFKNLKPIKSGLSQI